METSPSPGVSMQVQTMTDVNQRLQSSLADTTKAHQAERLKRDNLHKQVTHHCSHCIQLEPCMGAALTYCADIKPLKTSFDVDGGTGKPAYACVEGEGGQGWDQRGLRGDALRVCRHDHSKLKF